MSYRLKVNERAQLEIEDAVGFLESKSSVKIAIEFSEIVVETYQYIKSNPFLFQLTERYYQVPLRKFKYIMTYEVDEQTIIITSIFHTSQNPTKKPQSQ